MLREGFISSPFAAPNCASKVEPTAADPGARLENLEFCLRQGRGAEGDVTS